MGVYEAFVLVQLFKDVLFIVIPDNTKKPVTYMLL